MRLHRLQLTHDPQVSPIRNKAPMKEIWFRIVIVLASAISIEADQLCQLDAIKISAESCHSNASVAKKLTFGRSAAFSCVCPECRDFFSDKYINHYPYWIRLSANASVAKKNHTFLDCCDETEQCRGTGPTESLIYMQFDYVNEDVAGEYVCMALRNYSPKESVPTEKINAHDPDVICKITIDPDSIEKNPGSPNVTSRSPSHPRIFNLTKESSPALRNVSCQFDKSPQWKEVDVTWMVNGNTLPLANKNNTGMDDVQLQGAYQHSQQNVSEAVAEVVLTLDFKKLGDSISATCVVESPHYEMIQELFKVSVVLPDVPTHSSNANSDAILLVAIIVPICFVCAVAIACAVYAYCRFFRLSPYDENAEPKKTDSPTDPFGRNGRGSLPASNGCGVDVNPVTTFWNGVPEIFEGNVRFGDKIGEGQFGKVFMALVKGIPGSKSTISAAVKVAKESDDTSSGLQDYLRNEAEIICKVGNHPTVVSLLAIMRTQGSDRFSLVMELAIHGTLKEYLKSLRKKKFQDAVSTPMMLSFALQIASGMNYLISKKCIHRDLAARNVLVYEDENVKLSDFGLARKFQNKDYYRKKSKDPTPFKWTAPEALVDKVYSESSEVWSYGIVCWEIATYGGNPYPGVPGERLFELLTSPAFKYRMSRPRSCPDSLYDIMTKCWAGVPSDRPKFADILCQLDTREISTSFSRVSAKSDLEVQALIKSSEV